MTARSKGVRGVKCHRKVLRDIHGNDDGAWKEMPRCCRQTSQSTGEQQVWNTNKNGFSLFQSFFLASFCLFMLYLCKLLYYQNFK